MSSIRKGRAHDLSYCLTEVSTPEVHTAIHECHSVLKDAHGTCIEERVCYKCATIVVGGSDVQVDRPRNRCAPRKISSHQVYHRAIGSGLGGRATCVGRCRVDAARKPQVPRRRFLGFGTEVPSVLNCGGVSRRRSLEAQNSRSCNQPPSVTVKRNPPDFCLVKQAPFGLETSFSVKRQWNERTWGALMTAVDLFPLTSPTQAAKMTANQR